MIALYTQGDAENGVVGCCRVFSGAGNSHLPHEGQSQIVNGAMEEINYNNHFEFGILQGRLGFGTQGTVYHPLHP